MDAKHMTLGSLFDGAGTCPLAATLNGISPVWASEIEPYPISVTKARFPGMKHLGDVTKINGAEITPVDIITFGSPCQDLSVAGNRAGLVDGKRSNLFFEAVRIIKEMRDATNGRYPRYAVWENVPGAFSSNQGRDFLAVIQALCAVKENDVCIPEPKGRGGKIVWDKAGCVVGSGYSVAWRVLDAQYWGVPQRRKRIYLVADFGGERAGEILFEPESVRRDSTPGRTAREGTAGDAERGVGGGHECLTPWDVQSRRVHDDSGAWPAIYGGEGGGHGYVLRQANPADAEGSVGRGVLFEPMSALDENWAESSVKNALRAGASKSSHAVCYVLQGNGIDRADTAGCNGAGWRENECYTLNTIDRPAVAYSVDCRNMNLTKEHGTLQAKENGGQSLNYMGAVIECMRGFGDYVEDGAFSAIKARDYKDAVDLVRIKTPRRYIIRRLTPLECCRLQGFPDWWEDGVQGSDSAKYKMWGNGMALPCVEFVIRRIKEAHDNGR